MKTTYSIYENSLTLFLFSYLIKIAYP